MNSLLALAAVVVGFSAVMLAGSLFVSVVVRLLVYFSKKRGKTVAEMLGSLIVAFRTHNGDLADAGDDAQNAFVVDVLTDPILHLPKTMGGGRGNTTGAMNAERTKLALNVEYLPREQLLHIVEAKLENGHIPSAWHRQLGPEKTGFRVFAAFVERWYQTVESVSLEAFRLETRRLVVIVSCTIVVLFNFDGIATIQALYGSSTLRDELAARAPDLAKLSEREDAKGPLDVQPDGSERALHESDLALLQTLGVLNEPALALGWQESWFVKRWCAYQGCDDGKTPPELRPKRGEIASDALRWLAGLLFSCFMLSLGAPFWADTLKNLLQLQNEIHRSSLKRTEEAKRAEEPPAKSV